jgi:hypothetical protein
MLDQDGWSRPRLGRYNPEKENHYPLYRKLSGPQGRSGWVQTREKSVAPPPLSGFESRTVQPEAGCYAGLDVIAGVMRHGQQSLECGTGTAGLRCFVFVECHLTLRREGQCDTAWRKAPFTPRVESQVPLHHAV